MCITIIGALRPMSSSSNASKNLMVTDIPCFKVSNDSDITGCAVEVYSPNDIATYLKLDTVKLHDWTNEDIQGSSQSVKEGCKNPFLWQILFDVV